jgi:phenylalanyl-tRNA synthetase beta subunit
MSDASLGVPKYRKILPKKEYTIPLEPEIISRKILHESVWNRPDLLKLYPQLIIKKKNCDWVSETEETMINIASNLQNQMRFSQNSLEEELKEMRQQNVAFQNILTKTSEIQNDIEEKQSKIQEMLSETVYIDLSKRSQAALTEAFESIRFLLKEYNFERNQSSELFELKELNFEMSKNDLF